MVHSALLSDHCSKAHLLTPQGYFRALIWEQSTVNHANRVQILVLYRHLNCSITWYFSTPTPTLCMCALEQCMYGALEQCSAAFLNKVAVYPKRPVSSHQQPLPFFIFLLLLVFVFISLFICHVDCFKVICVAWTHCHYILKINKCCLNMSDYIHWQLMFKRLHSKTISQLSKRRTTIYSQKMLRLQIISWYAPWFLSNDGKTILLACRPYWFTSAPSAKKEATLIYYLFHTFGWRFVLFSFN